MAPTEVDLSKGGVVTLVLGTGYELPTEFAFHPQVHVVDASLVNPTHEGWIPSTTKIVIHTDHIPEKVYQYLQTIVRQRRLVYLPRKANGAILTELRRLLPVKPANGNGAGKDAEKPGKETKAEAAAAAEGKTIAARGSIIGLVKELADLRKGSSEEGKRLFHIAQQRGIKTTLGSVKQAVTQAKRKQGRGDIPLSAQPAQGAGIQVYAGIQAAIEALTQIQAHAETLEKDKAAILSENADLKARIEIMKGAWKDLG